MKRQLTVLLVIFICSIGCTSKNTRTMNFQKQLGTYVFDIQKTNLGSYSKDSNLYRNLQIKFNADSTFSMNMRVPFLYDSVGKWIPSDGGLEDWNRLYFKSWHYNSFGKNTGNQFTGPWTIDSIFYINGATPQNSAYSIQEIYFKKVLLTAKGNRIDTLVKIQKDTSNLSISSKWKLVKDTTLTFSIEGLSSEGSEVEAHYVNNSIRDAKWKIFGETGQWNITYTFLNDGTVRVSEKKYGYKTNFTEVNSKNDFKLNSSLRYSLDTNGVLLSKVNDKDFVNLFTDFKEHIPMQLSGLIINE